MAMMSISVSRTAERQQQSPLRLTYSNKDAGLITHRHAGHLAGNAGYPSLCRRRSKDKPSPIEVIAYVLSFKCNDE